MRIIDAHHHLWDLQANHYPWLLDPGTPRLYGDHAPICRDYRLADFVRDSANWQIVKSVHVQADHDFSDPVRETRWLQSVADDPENGRGLPNAIVAFADFSAPDIARVLEAHCRSPNMRGVRQALNGIVTNPAKHPDLLADERWHRNLGLLARFGLSFDLQLLTVQMERAAALARRHEGVQFILLHAGLPMDRSASGIDAWRDGLRRLAALPNVAVKISGFGMSDRAWTTESIRPLVLTTIDLFGVDRAMFGSNFPVDGMMASYDRIWQSFLDITAGFSADERTALFHDNAARLYRI